MSTAADLGDGGGFGDPTDGAVVMTCHMTCIFVGFPPGPFFWSVQAPGCRTGTRCIAGGVTEGDGCNDLLAELDGTCN